MEINTVRRKDADEKSPSCACETVAEICPEELFQGFQ